MSHTLSENLLLMSQARNMSSFLLIIHDYIHSYGGHLVHITYISFLCPVVILPIGAANGRRVAQHMVSYEW